MKLTHQIRLSNPVTFPKGEVSSRDYCADSYEDNDSDYYANDDRCLAPLGPIYALRLIPSSSLRSHGSLPQGWFPILMELPLWWQDQHGLDEHDMNHSTARQGFADGNTDEDDDSNIDGRPRACRINGNAVLLASRNPEDIGQTKAERKRGQGQRPQPIASITVRRLDRSKRLLRCQRRFACRVMCCLLELYGFCVRCSVTLFMFGEADLALHFCICVV